MRLIATLLRVSEEEHQDDSVKLPEQLLKEDSIGQLCEFGVQVRNLLSAVLAYWQNKAPMTELTLDQEEVHLETK